MCADKVKNIVTLSSDISAPLIADMQYFELYSTEALNRKMKNIVLPGVYCGFEPVPGDGLFVRITSEKTEGRGAASVDVGKCQISVQQVSDVVVPVEAGVTTIIVLEANYEHGVKTNQVDSSSDISAARIIALVDEEIASNQIELCRVIVPDNAQAVTADMISTEYRANRAVGVEFSSALDSDEEYKAATPLAISTLNKLKAPVDSPEFIGIPTSPTPEQGTNSTQIANAAFVQAAITALIDGSPSALDTLKKIADAINNDPQFSQTINDALALKAPLLSPAFTGVPTAPTASQGTNNTQIATTAYVRAAISALVGSSPEALDTLNELAAALGNDPNFATTMTNALAGKQPLDATLTALAGLATGANKLPYFTGTDTVSQTDLTSVGRDILAKTSVLAVIQYLGLRELGTSGEKIPLLSTANTWNARQTFNGGITGALTGNADTATKLKTARKINNVSFDGSADITLTPANLDVTSLTFMKNNGEMPVDADLNAFGPVEAYLGVWSKSTSTNATPEKNFPEDGAVGVLEVFNGGNFSGMQRYTTRTGNVYMRNLSGTWNGSDGPWSVWRNVQGTARTLDDSMDLDFLAGEDNLGTWRNSSSTLASLALHYPEAGSYAQGVLEVLKGGGFSYTQRYTTRRGNMYVRCLAANWDASNPQWEPWLRIGSQTASSFYDGDLNDLTDPGIYSVTGKASNGPLLDSSGATLLGVLEVIRRFDYVAVLQRYTTTGTGTTTKGRSYERVYTASSWSEWREVYTSYSLPLNLGIGGAAAKLTSLDWQTYDFVPGSLITVRLDNMTNIPDGMDWGVIDGNLINISVGPSDDSGTGRSMHVWRSTVSKANYRFFMVRISGNPGSRTITTRRVPIIDEAQTWSAHQTFSGGLGGELSGNAATATKLQTARTIGGVSFDGTANINLPGVNTAGNQSTTGNAATATKLQTARTIGGVSFDGSANINLPGVNIAGNQNTTGNAATATKLQTARTINGVNFDGSANISIPTITSRGRVTALTGTTQGATTGLQMYEAYNNGYPSAYGNVLHLKGATAAGEGELFIGWSGTSGAHAPVHVRSRRDTDTASWSEWAQVYTSKDSIPGVNTTGNQNTTGNAASATKLQTARTIGGVSFNGTANIDLPGVNKTGNQSTTGNAATATKLQTARTIGGISFDGTANINLPGVNIAGNQNTSGNAATATKLKTARKISGVAFDGSADITLTASHVGALPTTGGTVTGEIISSSQNAIRLTYNNNYGFLITNTGYSFQISTTGQNVNGDVVYTPLKIDGGDGRVELGRADGHVRVMGNLSAAGQITPGNYSNFNTKYQAKNTAYANIHGWHKDTSTRVMMQWGFITNLTPGSVVNFPTTFPEACAVVVISPHSGNAVNSILYTYNHSATGFTVKSSSTDKIYAQYVAYGY